MDAFTAIKTYRPLIISQLLPKSTTMWFKVRFADDTEEVFEIKIFPQKGQNYNDAVQAVREILADTKSQYPYSAVLIKFVTLKESYT